MSKDKTSGSGHGSAGSGNNNGNAGKRPSTTQRNDGPKNLPPKK